MGFFLTGKELHFRVLDLILYHVLKIVKVFERANATMVFAGVLYWVDSVNSGDCIRMGNLSLGVNMLIFDDKANITEVSRKYAEMSADPSIDFMFGPVNSDFAIAARTQTEAARRLFIGTASASSAVYKGTSFTFNAVTSAKNYLTSIIPLMRLKEARSTSRS